MRATAAEGATRAPAVGRIYAQHKARQAAQRQRQQVADDAAGGSPLRWPASRWQGPPRVARRGFAASLVEAPAAAPPAVIPPLPLHRGLSRKRSSVAALAPDELLTVRALIEESDRTFHAMFAPKLPRSSKLAAEAAAARRAVGGRQLAEHRGVAAAAEREARGGASRGDELAAATKSGSLRLLALCDELIDTELHYFRELELLSEHFVRPLRAGERQGLVSNVEQLVELHGGLVERLAAAAERYSGERLADAIGSELMRVCPYLQLYVPFCSNFVPALGLLDEMRAHRPAIARLLATAEEGIRQVRIAERGDGAPVALLSLLIKPVQRLCQYPLLFRDIASQMGGPPLADAPPNACPYRGRGKAEYVLDALEAVAQMVNAKVRALELQHRRRAEFGGGGGDALSLLGPALSLRCEARITFEKRAAKAPASLSFSIGRSLSFRRKGARKDGKLYVFAHVVLIAAAEKDGATYRPLVTWPAKETTAELKEEAVAPARPRRCSSQERRGSATPRSAGATPRGGGTDSPPVSEEEAAIALSHPGSSDDVFVCRLAKSEAEAVLAALVGIRVAKSSRTSCLR